MPEEERRTWLRALAPDDAADLIQDAPPKGVLLPAGGTRIRGHASASAPAVAATLVDVPGLVICFSMAKVFMLKGLT